MPTAAERELRLRVAEALPEDVGHKRARVDAQDLLELGAAPGDVLLVTGARATVARAVEAPQSHCGRKLILVDGHTRANAQLGVDEQATVRKVAFRPAESLLLAPIEAACRCPPSRSCLT